MSEYNRYMEHLNLEIDKCNREIEAANHQATQTNAKKTGLILARDHFTNIFPEPK